MRETRPGRASGNFSTRGVVGAVLVLLLAAVCVRLGFWQLDRLEQRREHNARLRAATALPPLTLEGDSLAAVLRDPEPFLFRRVRVSGAYLPEGEVVLRGRSLEGSPGVHLLTPLRVAGTPWAVMVNRGWAPSPDALTLDPRPLAEPGRREVEGILQPFPPDARETRPLESGAPAAPVLSIQRLDSALLREIVPAPILPAYVQQLPGGAAPEGVRRLPAPALGEGPHLGYAVQWFSFATIAVVGLLVLVIRSRRPPA